MFGDAVYFDTSYQSITYGVLFGAWLGIDNHGRTIFFGCVLLQDETPHSFSWAFQISVFVFVWKSTSGVLCDRRMPLKLKGKFYRTAIRSAMLYGTECWAVKYQHIHKNGCSGDDDASLEVWSHEKG
ncbi:unnamed protein product [Malus baccata var. baccata]